MSLLARRLEPEAVAAAVGLAVSALWLAGVAGALDAFAFPLDDTYIHLQYAHELAEGRPFSYDADDPETTGATSTLWPLLLVPGFWLGGTDAALAWTAVVCALLVAATGAAVAWAARPLAGGRLALLAALAIVLNGWFLTTALSGMESALIAFGVTVLLGAIVHGHLGLTVAALVVVALTRPEGALAALLIGGVLLVHALRARELRRAALAALPILVTLTQAAAWMVVSGRPSTDTAVSKSVVYDPTLAVGLQLATWLAALGRAPSQFLTGALSEESHAEPGAFLVLPVVTVGLALVGAILMPPRRRAAVVGAGAAVAAAYLGVAATADWAAHNFRYLTALLPPLALLGVAGAAALQRTPRSSRIVTSVVGALVIIMAAGMPLWHARYVESAGQINAQHVWLGRWLAANLAPDARIAFHDAGALKLYSGRDHFDWLGLVSPHEAEAYRAGWGAIYERLERFPEDERPDYFVMWPNTTQRLIDMPFVEEQVFESPDLGPASMLGGPTMAVFEAEWPSTSTVDRPPVAGRAVWSLDVAHLDDEARAGYEPAGPDPLRGPPTEVFAAAPTRDAPPFADGCRELTGERFRLPGLGTLVGRIAGGIDAELLLEGRPAGRLSSGGDAGIYSSVSARLVSGGEVEIRSAAPYVSCHWWLLAADG